MSHVYTVSSSIIRKAIVLLLTVFFSRHARDLTLANSNHTFVHGENILVWIFFSICSGFG